MITTAACSLREVKSVSILDFSGTITLGDGTELVRHSIRDLIAKGRTNILLNLAQVDFLDSSGIATLVNSYTYAREHGARVKLLHLKANIHDLLQITKLNTLFDIFDDEAAAVASFQEQKKPQSVSS
jgi:anti-sigma B factor antagonist